MCNDFTDYARLNRIMTKLAERLPQLNENEQKGLLNCIELLIEWDDLKTRFDKTQLRHFPIRIPNYEIQADQEH